jgi:hypothetical protein
VGAETEAERATLTARRAPTITEEAPPALDAAGILAQALKRAESEAAAIRAAAVKEAAAIRSGAQALANRADCARISADAAREKAEVEAAAAAAETERHREEQVLIEKEATVALEAAEEATARKRELEQV